MMYDEIIKALEEVLTDRGLSAELEPDLELICIIDSMSILEVLIILEQENGYETRLIRVDKIITIQDLVDQVEEHNIQK